MAVYGTKKAPITELELALQVEQDLQHQRRQFSLLEKQRCMRGTDPKMVRGNKILKIHRRESKNLKVDLLVATSEGKVKQDKKVAKQLAELLKESDDAQAQVNVNKLNIKEISDEIYTLEKEVTENRSKQVTDLQIQDRMKNGQKTLETLENRLDMQTKKYGTILTENRQLKEEIEQMIKERLQFNKLWEKIVGGMQVGKKYMLDLIEQATIAYDQREELCAKLFNIRVRAYSDLVRDTQIMGIVQGKLDYRLKLLGFMTTKGQRIIMNDLEEKTKKKMQQRKAELKSKMTQYKVIIKNIMTLTAHDSLTTIVQQYKKQDTENFKKFIFINQLNNEMEGTAHFLKQLHDEISCERDLNSARESHQKNTLAALRQNLINATAEADEAQAGLDAKDALLSEMMKGVEELSKLCKCENDSLVELLGINDHVNSYNLSLWISLIENKVSDMLLAVYHKQKNVKKGTSYTKLIQTVSSTPPQLHTIEEIIKTNPCPLCVQHRQVSDVIDTLQFALTREQIREQLKKTIAQPGGLACLHNVSDCNLPESRQIIQRRYYQ